MIVRFFLLFLFCACSVEREPSLSQFEYWLQSQGLQLEASSYSKEAFYLRVKGQLLLDRRQARLLYYQCIDRIVKESSLTKKQLYLCLAIGSEDLDEFDGESIAYLSRIDDQLVYRMFTGVEGELEVLMSEPYQATEDAVLLE
ncbi:MAG: hypothetical protein CMO81_00800 [Waddliaceae bacterium]|nr:hypothetical protein [Waddliaceae bacterium]